MGIRFRKSVKLGKGVRLNFSRKGVGISGGVKGLSVGTGSSGSRMRATLPGTGLYTEKRLSKRKKGRQHNPIKEQQLKLQEKAQKETDEKEQAKLEVEAYENYIQYITSLHKADIDDIDWEQIKTSSPPFQRGSAGPNEEQAIQNLEGYKPTIRDRLFNRIEARKRILNEKIEKAKKEDKSLYEEWEKEVQLASNLLNGDLNAYKVVLVEDDLFSDISGLGSKVKFHIHSPDILEIVLFINAKTVIPREVKKLTKTGKVSSRKMAKTKYFSLHKDYVCSSVLRIAREIFSALPSKKVYIHARDSMIEDTNAQTEAGTIVSVEFTKEFIRSLNFANVDTQSAIESANHHMKFRKTKGFAFVEKIAINS